MSRRSKNKEKDVSEFVKDELVGSIEKLMINRHKLMAPFPVPAMDIYQLCWSTKQHEAFQVLGNSLVLRKAKQFTINGIHAFSQVYQVRITCDQEMPMPRDMETPSTILTEAMRSQIEDWVPVWLRYKEQTDQLTEKVRRVGKHCTTYGQLVRIWPDLQGFLGEYGTAKVHKAKAKSPYPAGVLEWGDNSRGDELIDEYKPAAFEPFSSMIAECLMLPVIDDLIHVGFVSSY